MKIEPRHLLQIAAIVESGTFSLAAERLGTSQPALSRVVSLLERRLGTTLFDRTIRPPAPTEAGLALAEQGRAIQAASAHAVHAIDRITKGDFGSVRIGAPPFLCDHLLSGHIGDFISAHPRIRVELAPDFFPSLQRRLLADDIDMIFGPITLVDRTLPFHIERLLDDSNVVVCRASHPLSRKRAIKPGDLERSNWISHSSSSTLHADMQMALTMAGVNKINLCFESSSAAAVLNVLERSDCLTMLPRNVASRLAVEGKITILLFANRSPARPIGIVTHASRPSAIAAPTLMRFLRNAFS
ncbi:MAG: LysR family transcriptional regulator [Beijerinckiaceae bacterium]|nr:LysR family transcriptional regulator [Beijerinckiaceae bacterium]